MWKNKHLVVSMLVAPVLAVVAYFATDYVVSEPPHAARAGETYPLMARSNCRYASGQCDLVNGDVELKLSMQTSSTGQAQLLLSSVLPLKAAGIAIAADAGKEAPPTPLEAANPSFTQWRHVLPLKPDDTATLRLAVAAGDSHYYAEVPAVFLQAEITGSR